MRLAVMCVLLLIGAVAQGQSSAIWPPEFRWWTGEHAQATPFSLSPNQTATKARNMTVINPASLPFGKGSTISGIAFRREGEGEGTYAAQTGGRLRVQFGATNRTELNLSHRFDDNWSQTPTIVFDQSLNLPQAPPPTGNPPFAIPVAFTKPWTYNGGGMAIDLLYSHTAATTEWFRDAATYSRGDRRGRSSTIGPGCTGSNGMAPYTYALTGTALPGRELVIALYGSVPPVQPEEFYAINIVGYSTQNHGSTPLPFDLSLIGLGTGCKLYQNIIIFQAFTVTPANAQYSRAYALYPIPNSPFLANTAVYTQWFCFDSQVGSSLKVTASNGAEIFLGEPGTPHNIGQTLWLYGASGGSTDMGETMPGQDYVAVIEFTGTLL